MILAKYIHILPSNELKFNKPLYRLLCDPQNDLYASDHLFITTFPYVYQSLKDCGYDRIILDNSGEHLINKYAPLCQLLICQNFPSPVDTLKIRPKYYSKIVFRTWGGSRQRGNMTGGVLNKVRVIFGDILYYLFKNFTVANSYAIGIANEVDAIDIRKWMKYVPLYVLPLGDGEIYRIINSLDKRIKQEDESYNILLGHQGEPSENHISILKILLDRFNNENIHIYIPFSYGNKDYISETLPKLKSLSNDKVTILTDFLSIDDYIQLLNNIDIAIFDEASSMALGNISILLSLRKKIVLNRKGVLYEAFTQLGINCLSSDLLNSITFDSLISPVLYSDNIKTLEEHDISYIRNKWKEILDSVN